MLHERIPHAAFPTASDSPKQFSCLVMPKHCTSLQPVCYSAVQYIAGHHAALHRPLKDAGKLVQEQCMMQAKLMLGVLQAVQQA